MSEPDTTRKAFSVWFWLFLAVTVVIVAYEGQLSLASSHAFTASVMVRQMSIIYDEDQHKKRTEKLVQELKKRLDNFDPYSDE